MNRRGFTLIELLAVIIILGIILTIAVTTVSGIIESTNKDGFKSSLKIALKQARNKIVTGSDGGSLSTLNITQNNLYGEWYNNGGVATIKAGSANKDYMIATDVTLDNVLNIELIPIGLSDQSVFNNTQVANVENINTNTLSSYFEQLNIYGKSNQESYALVSTGTQYIDTKFMPNQDTRIEMKLIDNVAGSTYVSYFGVRNNSTQFFGHVIITGSSEYQARYNDAMSSSIFNRGVVNTIEQNKNFTYINGVLKNTFVYSNFQSTNNMYLFGANSNGALQYPLTGKVYYAKIYDNNTLIRDLVPVPQGSTIYSSTPAPQNCLWDKVTKQYFTNKGTGSFSIENTVAPDNSVNINSSNNFNLISEGKNLLNKNNYIIEGFHRYNLKNILTIGETYTISGNSNMFFKISYAAGAPGNDSLININNVTKQTFTWRLRSDGREEYLYVGNNAVNKMSDTEFANANIQLERGSTATSYLNYSAPNQITITSTLRSIQAPNTATDYTYTDGANKYYSDYIEIKNGKVSLVRNIGVDLLNGINGGAFSGIPSLMSGTTQRFYKTGFDTIENKYISSIGNTNAIGCMSNKFLNNASDLVEGCKLTGVELDNLVLNKSRLGMLETDNESQRISKANIWLQSNNVILHYQFSQPLITDITNTSEGQMLLSLKSQEDFTRLYTSGSDLALYIKSQVKIKK